MVKMHYRLVLLLVVLLTIGLFSNGVCDPTPIIPPPIPTQTTEEQSQNMEEVMASYGKLNEFLGRNQEFIPEFPVNIDDDSHNYHPPYTFSSRSGSQYKQDFIIQNLTSTARCIHGDRLSFTEKEFYKSNFSIAMNIEAVNQKLAEQYADKPVPQIVKGTVVLIDIFDPISDEIIYSGWGKINTDTASDINQINEKNSFAKNKVCLAVDSTMRIDDFAGMEAKIYVFISHPPSAEFLQQQMLQQGTIVRPVETLRF